MEHECTEERFLSDISDHKMRIINNTHVNRHLRFERPDTFAGWFDIITWRGHLCISGDYGTYVFARLDDMFVFFRDDREGLNINPSYWGEKLQSVSRFGGYKEYCSAYFKEAVKQDFDDHFEDCEDEDKKRRVWAEVESQVLSVATEYDGLEMPVDAAMRFECEGFGFYDFYEHPLERFTFQFIWCLYAIAWSVQEFDRIQKEQTPDRDRGLAGDTQ